MSDNKRLKNYDDLPLVLDVADIRRIMGISRVSAYELFYPQLGVKLCSMAGGGVALIGITLVPLLSGLFG